MLTGIGYQAGALTPDQVHRVAQLADLDVAMQGIALGRLAHAEKW